MKTPGGAELYNILVEYIAGHNPDLIVTRKNGLKKDIDFIKYKTTAALHRLMFDEGFIARPLDKNDPICIKLQKQCLKNAAYVNNRCFEACPLQEL